MQYVLENHDLRLLPKCVTPIICGYFTEVDVDGDLNEY